eukprot:12883053-Prorocentrum_lima.AAC.1
MRSSCTWELPPQNINKQKEYKECLQDITCQLDHKEFQALLMDKSYDTLPRQNTTRIRHRNRLI